MALQAGAYNLTAHAGKLYVYTFKEGFLSAVAHDLLMEVTRFTIHVIIPDKDIHSASIKAEIMADSLKVICAMKDGQRQPDTLKEKDKTDIEEATFKDVLHPAKYPSINFESTDIQGKDGVYHIKGKLTLHGVTHPLEFDAQATTSKDIKGTVTLSQKDYGIKPYKALLGTLKVKNEVNVVFDLSLK